MSDGTFQVVPTLYLQLFGIHGTMPGQNDVSYPLVFALLTSKQTSMYSKLFEMLRDEAVKRGYDVLVKMHLSDFEIGISNSVNGIFPQAKTYACYFHYTHNMIRRLKKFRLYSEYCNNEDFKTTV